MKILVTIISSKKHVESRITPIKETWLKDFSNYLIISDYTDENLNTVKITEDNTYESAVEKNIKSFPYLYENYPDFDWFINLDDDSFVNYENLVNYIETLPTQEVIKIGHLNIGSAGYGINYHSGGAGTLFNREALKILRKITETNNYNYFRDKNGEYKPNQTPFADANVGIFCDDNGIEQIHSNLFNPREPNFYNYTLEEIKKQITFHYIFGEEFYKLYKLIK